MISDHGTARRRLLNAIAVAAIQFPPSLVAKESTMASKGVFLYAGELLGQYGFPNDHPLGLDRQGAFLREAASQGLTARARMRPGRAAKIDEIRRFHTQVHVEKVRHAEEGRVEFLDNGDTPVFPGVFAASSNVVGAALDGLACIMRGECARSFQPIGGLHHAGRDHSAGFCVFSDLGVVIETLRIEHGVRRIAYVDIDVHHGDGVFYAYEEDPDLIFADIHEDGRALYPGTGREDETGKGPAKGTKLNIALKAGSDDADFMAAWPRVEEHLCRFEPQFLVMQCGADGLKGDPLAHLQYTPRVHAHAARRLRQFAEKFCAGRMMAFGGGGYDRSNLARAWSAVLGELV